MKSKTFARPLQKQGGNALNSMFNHKGDKAIGDVYRLRLGGPPFPIKQDAPLKERWFCSASGCNLWRDEEGKTQGTCAGYCYG